MSRSRATIRKAAAWATVGMLMLVCATATAQSRKDLEKKRADLDKQIRTTTALIEQARKEQRTTQGQLDLLESRIQAREQLIRTMGGEVRRVEQRIAEDEEMVRSLQADLEGLKEEYGRMLQFAYRNRSAYDRMSYIFAAADFQQAWKRGRYLDQIAQQRNRQARLIEEAQEQIAARLQGLKEQRAAKVDLLNEQQAERRRLDADRSGQVSALSDLKKEEGRLRETQKKQEQQRKQLDAAIRKAIEAELKPKPGAAKGGKLDITLTPEAKELNADFEKNRGKLPWPVEKGVITSRFGKQNHPVLPGIVIENNGIDITTEPNAPVRALFRGEVTSVLVMPGAGKAVILSHGVYRSVYSNLRDVSVAKGQKVGTKQPIGTVLTDENGSKAHLELWKVTADGLVKVDPAQWLYR
ncbi:MAG: peptidoglycan DD-metalloendopeptidase family protein [Flavobacteriales bacterium]|jgi:septal ring factor EnvC (AmiA/AmiB activator)|nr:peptidoglycan DD-metalloendopeptidase family protein [Flavobacteriales bacterium]